MAVTPDLPPGARSRMWLLTGFTATMGLLTYWRFGRTEILWLTGAVLAVLLYLLLGVTLTLRRDRQVVTAILARLEAALPADWWLVLDPGGVVLALSNVGMAALGHSAVLVGQRLSDVLLEASRPQLSELLNFGRLGEPWDGRLALVAENGERRQLAVATLPMPDPEARRFGMVAVGGDREQPLNP